MHDPDYRASLKDWESFVESLTDKIIEKDETVPELPPKDLVRSFVLPKILNFRMLTEMQTFRIYRDVRFSSDQTPYKVRKTCCTAFLQNCICADVHHLAPLFGCMVRIS